MQRAVVHGVVIGLLFAVGAGFVVSLRWPWGAPGPLGFSGIAPLVVGGLGLVVCVWAGVALAGGRRVPPLVLLAAPVGCLVLAACAELTGVLAVMREYEDLLATWPFHRRWFWLADRLAVVRSEVAVGLVAAGLAFGAAATTARRGIPGHDADRGRAWWIVPALGWTGALAATAIIALWMARVWSRIEDHGWTDAWSGIGTHLAAFGRPDGWALWWPLLIPILALGLLSLLLARIPPGDVEDRTSSPVNTLRGTVIAGGFGAGVCLAVAAWLYGGARALHATSYVLGLQTLAEKQAVLGGPAMYVSGLYRAEQLTAPLLLAAIVLVVAASIAVTRTPARSVAIPLGLVLVSLVIAGSLAAPSFHALDRVLGPYCEERCSEIDRIHAAMTLRRWHTNKQIEYDRCFCDVFVPEGDALRLPRVPARLCAEVAPHLQVRKDQILLDGRAVLDLQHSHLPEDRHERDLLLEELHRDLVQIANEGRAVGDRNPGHPFRGMLSISADAATPMGTIDTVRAAATAAGLVDHRFLVVVPDHAEPIWVRQLRIDPQDPTDPMWRLQGEEWTLLITPDGAQLRSPDGAVQVSATDPADLARQIRPHVEARGAPTAIALVQHHDEVTLEEELRYRTALAEDQLFNAVYTAYPPAIPVAPPALPVVPAP